MLYLAQEVYKVPLGITFTAQNFGPYDSAVKKAITAGMSKRNNFFRRGKNGTIALAGSSSKIFKYKKSRIMVGTDKFLIDIMPHLSNADSGSIERLATVQHSLLKCNFSRYDKYL